MRYAEGVVETLGTAARDSRSDVSPLIAAAAALWVADAELAPELVGVAPDIF